MTAPPPARTPAPKSGRSRQSSSRVRRYGRSAELASLVGVLAVVAVAWLADSVAYEGRRGLRPYTIEGVRYEPRVYDAYSTVGTASWYGHPFHGRATANGEIYDQEAFTAAHPTLPLGTRVKVTNLANGRSVILTVNDRGPFVGDRLIDVSRLAARRLGFKDAGLAQVRVTALHSPLQ
jgi:rare lipoprotein A (peptidoglycan hydrolase)